MKTDYTQDLNDLIDRLWNPSDPTNPEANPTTLKELYNDITNLLPQDWVKEADLYNALNEKGYKAFQYKIETVTEDDDGNKKTTTHHYPRYFITLNHP